MRVSILLYVMIMIAVASCQDKPTPTTDTSEPEPKPKRPSALADGKFIAEEDKKLLWGGEDSTWHFDITNSELIDSQYHYGIGRERFDALTDPEFMTEEEADVIYPDSARFLIFSLNGQHRAYGIDLLTHHEVVNDVVDGEPVAAAYCILADLGAMYSRRSGDTTLTFALSGYTYYDPEVWGGMDGFVWWDRETESTWWPLIGQGVSGALKDVPLKVFDDEQWKQTTWGQIKGNYEVLKVLKPGQEMEPPSQWSSFDENVIADIRAKEVDRPEAPPQWGENAQKP